MIDMEYKKRTTITVVLTIQGMRDSNPHRRFWRPVLYHWTNPLYSIEGIYLQNCTHATSYLPTSCGWPLPGQTLDRLVTVSSIHYCTSTSALSTSSSSRGLTSLKNGISHLEGGFTLRCLQRLSLPDLATLPCSWHCNRYTSGPSIPVLSY